MYSLEIIITVGLAATIIGLIAGFFIAQRAAPTQRSQRQLETHLHEMQQQQQDYQQEVSEHFVETATLLNQLSSSYRDVHNHLAKGAQLLAGENASESIKTLPGDTPSDNKPTDLDQNISPPLDYAPKKAPNTPGMLNEEFGLSKSKQQEEPDDPIATTNNAYRMD